MKAIIRKTGEIVEVIRRNKYGDYIDGNCVGYSPEDLIFDYEECAHWRDLRERAAIAAMQETIALLRNGDKTIYKDFVVERYNGSKGTCPDIIADFAVTCANALVDKLKG